MSKRNDQLLILLIVVKKFLNTLVDLLLKNLLTTIKL
jgi:hypothetical protein